MPNVVEREPEIGASTRTPLTPSPIILVEAPTVKFPFSGALIATPVEFEPLTVIDPPVVRLMSPLNAEEPSSSTPKLPALLPDRLIMPPTAPSFVKLPVNPPRMCTPIAPLAVA